MQKGAVAKRFPTKVFIRGVCVCVCLFNVCVCVYVCVCTVYVYVRACVRICVCVCVCVRAWCVVCGVWCLCIRWCVVCGVCVCGGVGKDSASSQPNLHVEQASRRQADTAQPHLKPQVAGGRVHYAILTTGAKNKYVILGVHLPRSILTGCVKQYGERPLITETPPNNWLA